jgi:hypothetical protein
MEPIRRAPEGKPPSVRLLPLWEKVPEGRMRGGRKSPQPHNTPQTISIPPRHTQIHAVMIAFTSP